MIFLLNITRVGGSACEKAVNLVVVDTPEGVESIGYTAFMQCSSLTTVSFPTTLKSIEDAAFNQCSSLDNVDLLHTNLQELGEAAYFECYKLKSMTIPYSLQTPGADCWNIFSACYKSVPSSIDTNDNDAVVTYLRSQQQ